MAKPFPHAKPSSSLHDRVAFSIALEEAAVEALSCALSKLQGWAPDEEVEAIERLIRSHRVGILKHRAIMGAHGIDV